MPLKVSAKTCAVYRKNGLRLAQRNGYRDRDWDWETRAGGVELHIPKLRTSRYFRVSGSWAGCPRHLWRQ